jgi:hypothetical protein
MELATLYIDNGFPGASKLYQLAKRKGLDVKYKDVYDFILKQRVSQLHKPLPKQHYRHNHLDKTK